MSYYDLTIGMIPVGYHPDAGHDGIEVRAIDRDWMLRALKEEFRWRLAIKDNGWHGDGCWLSVECDFPPLKVLNMYIPEESIEPIIQALQSVKRLRDATKTEAVPSER